MKNTISAFKNKILSHYPPEQNSSVSVSKTPDINVLLNRVKLDKKKESGKKILFSAAASAGVLLFGVIIF